MSTEERDRCGSVDSQSSEPSLDEDTFASHFAGIAAVSSDDELPQEPAAANGAQGPEPLSKEEKEKAWKDMLAAQDPYEADQKLPEFSFETVEVAGIQVKVRNYSGAQHRDLGTGRVVWPIAKLLANELAASCKSSAATPELNIKDKVVLELGSGPGFLSIFSQRLGATHVTMTDQATLLPLMKMNCSDNGVDDTQVSVAALDWNEKERSVFAPQRSADQPDREFDVILCSDLIYSGFNRDPCTPLAVTLHRYTAQEPGRSLIIFAFRERGNLSLDDEEGTVALFFKLLREKYAIHSRQLFVKGVFGDNCNGYRLFVLQRVGPAAGKARRGPEDIANI